MNQYLIPANSKKSQLILSVFTINDLILLISGVSVTLMLLIIVGSKSLGTIILMLLPGLICGSLVLPLPNYHNVLGFLTSFIRYINNRKQYYWKGWCVKDVYGRDFENK
jgi:hypothetical protein